MVGKLSDDDGMFHNPYALRSFGKPACIGHQILQHGPNIGQS